MWEFQFQNRKFYCGWRGLRVGGGMIRVSGLCRLNSTVECLSTIPLEFSLPHTMLKFLVVAHVAERKQTNKTSTTTRWWSKSVCSLLPRDIEKEIRWSWYRRNISIHNLTDNISQQISRGTVGFSNLIISRLLMPMMSRMGKVNKGASS